MDFFLISKYDHKNNEEFISRAKEARLLQGRSSPGPETQFPPARRLRSAPVRPPPPPPPHPSPAPKEGGKGRRGGQRAAGLREWSPRAAGAAAGRDGGGIPKPPPPLRSSPWPTTSPTSDRPSSRLARPSAPATGPAAPGRSGAPLAASVPSGSAPTGRKESRKEPPLPSMQPLWPPPLLFSAEATPPPAPPLPPPPPPFPGTWSASQPAGPPTRLT